MQPRTSPSKFREILKSWLIFLLSGTAEPKPPAPVRCDCKARTSRRSEGFVTYCPTGLRAAGRFRPRAVAEEQAPPSVEMIISSKGPPGGSVIIRIMIRTGGSVRGERANFTRLVLGCIEVNTRWKALAEIYTMHSFAPLWNRIRSLISKFSLKIAEFFAVFSPKFRKINKFAKILLNFRQI